MTNILNTNPLGLPVTLASGAVLAHGKAGTADLDHPEDAALVASGSLSRTDTVDDLRRLASDLNIEGRSKMSRAKLEKAVAEAQRIAAADALADTVRAAAASDAGFVDVPPVVDQTVPGAAGADTPTTEKES